MDKESAKRVLEEFCSFPISSADEVLYKFKNLPRAISRFDGDKRNFVYIPGTREDRVLLVAHADTVWDPFYNRFPTGKQSLCENNGV